MFASIIPADDHDNKTMTEPHATDRHSPQRRRWLACAWLIASVCVSAAACASESMTDPLLGIDYKTAAVHFDPWTPPSALASQGLPRSNWIYAKVAHDHCTFSIVSGLIPIDTDTDDDRVGASEPGFGAVIRQCGAVTTELGVPDNLFAPDAPVDDALASALLHDAVPRYIKAWGGKRQFQAALESLQRPELMPPVLMKALTRHGLGFRPAHAHGDVWSLDFQLPLTLTLCSEIPASPTSGFFLVARAHSCRRKHAVLTFTVQRERPSPAALPQQAGCRPSPSEPVNENQAWTLCADDGDDDGDLSLAWHRISCSDDAYVMRLQIPPAQRKSQAALLQNLIHHIRLHCPDA